MFYTWSRMTIVLKIHETLTGLLHFNYSCQWLKTFYNFWINTMAPGWLTRTLLHWNECSKTNNINISNVQLIIQLHYTTTELHSWTKYFGPEVISYVLLILLGLLSAPTPTPTPPPPHSVLFCLKMIVPFQVSPTLKWGRGSHLNRNNEM